MRRRRAMAEINVVPYIDVMLVLLIIFMVAAPLINPGQIDLPQAAQRLDPAVAPLEVRVRANGDLAVVDRNKSAEELRVSRRQLVDFVRASQRSHPDQAVVIAGDRSGALRGGPQGARPPAAEPGEARGTAGSPGPVKQKPAPPRALVKPRQPGRIRAVFLAVLVHAAFFALIVFGITWQSQTPPPVEAELWDKLPPAPDAKAPDPKPPEPEPPKPEPPPEPAKPEPVKPSDEKPEPPKPDPAITQKLEREKRDREKREKLDRDKVKKQKDEDARKKRVEEDASKKKREDDKRRQDEERLKREAEKAREAAVAARKTEVDRYIEAIKAKIRGRANVPDTVTGNPEVHVRIRILPGGEVLDIALTRRSANPTYDSAIERAIRSAQPLPVPPADSELFPQFRDLNLNFRHER